MKGSKISIAHQLGMTAAVVGLVLATGAAPAHADGELTITSFGGAYQEAQRKALFAPFAKDQNVKLLEDEWGGQMAKLRTMVQSGKVTWDVLLISDGQLPLACDEGLVERIDPALFGGKEHYTKGWTHDCGIGAIVASIVIGYNENKFPGEKPSTLKDFWDVKKFPGPRAMRKWPKHNLEFALLADGVPPDKLYEVLGTEQGVARALKKLDEIKPYVKVWTDNWAQPGQLLADGEVIMSTGTNGRLEVAARSAPHVKFFWDRQGYSGDMYAIVKGSKNRDNAIKFIRYATQPNNAARIVDQIPYAPPIPKALGLMTPEVVARLPLAPQNLKTAWVVDSVFWGDHLDDYELRFQAWLNK